MKRFYLLPLSFVMAVLGLAGYLTLASAQNPGPVVGPNAVLTGHPATAVAPATAPPTVTSCSTGAVAAGSTDAVGSVTATGATSCTVVFGTAWLVAPVCIVRDQTTAATPGTYTVSTTQIVLSTITANDVFSWVCFGKGQP